MENSLKYIKPIKNKAGSVMLVVVTRDDGSKVLKICATIRDRSEYIKSYKRMEILHWFLSDDIFTSKDMFKGELEKRVDSRFIWHGEDWFDHRYLYQATAVMHGLSANNRLRPKDNKSVIQSRQKRLEPKSMQIIGGTNEHAITRTYDEINPGPIVVLAIIGAIVFGDRSSPIGKAA
jgi:hypothetical protein